MAENYYSYLDALEAPSAGRAIPASPAAPLDSDEEFFRQIAEQATKAQAPEAAPQELGLGGRILTGVGDVLGAQKHGVDYLARKAVEGFGGEVNPEDTTGSMLRRAVGLEATPESGYLSRLAGSGLEFATDIATDPLTYETVVLGKLAGAGVKAGRVLAGLGEGAETVASLGRAAVPVADIQRAATLGKIAAPIATGAGAAFTGVLGAGAIQGGQQLAHTIQTEGFTPQAAEEALGTGLALGGGLAAGFHTAHPLFRKVNPVLKQGLESLVAKGELAPEEAAGTIARAQGVAPPPVEAPPARVAAEPQPRPAEAAPRISPAGVSLMGPEHGFTEAQVLAMSPEEQSAALEHHMVAPGHSGVYRGGSGPVLRMGVEPELPSIKAPIVVAEPPEPPVEAPPEPVEPLSAPPRVEVAAPPPTEAPSATESPLPIEAPPPVEAAPNPTATVPVAPESIDAWAERIEPLKALGYDDADILAFSRESNGLAHTDDILKRGRKAGGGVFRTRLGGKAREGPPPTPDDQLMDALKASLKPGTVIEESRRAPLPPGALEGTEPLAEQIVGKGFSQGGGRSIRDEYAAQEKALGKAGARSWLEEQFLATTERPPEEVLPKVQRASTRSIIEQLEETLPAQSPKSIYQPGSPAARLLERYPHRADFIQEKVTRLLAQDSPSAREVMALPAAERPEAIYRWLAGTSKKAELSAIRDSHGALSLEEAGQQAAEQAGSAFQGGGGHASLTDLPPDLKQRLREFKRANDSYAKDESGKLTPEGKRDLSARIEDLGQRLLAGFYEHPDEAVADLADLSNIATTYAKDFPSRAGTPWAAMQKALQKRLERIPGMEDVGDKSFEGFARKAAVRLGYSVEDWAKARFTQDPDFLAAMGKERAAGRLEGSERAPGAGDGLMGLLGRTEATPLEGHPDLSILNHTEARTPALDAATESFGKEAAPALKALYDRLRGLTGAQGGTLGGFTSSTAHEGAFSEGKSYLNPSYHFSDALHTAKMYGLEGDAEAVKSIAATRAVATLEHEFLHDLGGHKTEQQFAEALTKLHDATSADPEYAALEKAFRESISDQTVEQFRETSPIFDQLVKEKYGDSSNVGSREGALQGAPEGSPLAERGAQLRGSEGLPESGEGLGAERGGDLAGGAGRAGALDEGELAASSRHAPEDDGAANRRGGAEASPAGEQVEANTPKEGPEAARLSAARASGDPVEVAAAANDLLHKRLSDAAEAVEGDSKEVQRRKLLLKYAAKSIPKGEFNQKEFVKVMRNVGAPKEAAKGLWEAFKGSADSSAEFTDLFGKVVRPGGWKNWRTWVTIWKAGMLGIPTQTGNTLGNAVFQQLRDVEGGVASFIDAIHAGVTGKERTRYASEIGAAWRGRARAWQEAWPDLKEAIAQAAKLEGMSLTDLEKHLGSYEEATKGLLNAPHDSKIFEFLTIPLKALGAADNFAKHMLKWEEFYREGHRQGTASGLRGKALHEFEAQQAGVMDRALQSTGEGMLFEKHAKSILRAAERMEKDTFQTPLGGEKAGWISKGAAALNRAKADLPPLELIAPFTKTPANIAIETLMRTPYGFRKVYKAWKAGEYKSDPGKLYDELAKPMLGTSIMVGVMGQVFGNAITGQGPADPKQQALKRETGWQPYSIKIGDAYVPYNRLEPLGSVLGMAADIGEAVRDGKHSTAQVKLKLAIASVGKNLTNKTFLAGLNNAFQATTDPVRFGPTLVKQLTGSIVPNIAGVVPVGSLAGAIDPIQRKTTVLTAPLAKIPGVSKLLPEQETALGTPRERTGGEGIGAGLQRLLFPSQITSVRHDVAARVAGELDRLDFPMQPPRPYIEISGRRIELSKEQQKRLAEAQFNAVNHMNRMIQDRTYQGLPDSPEDALPGQKTKEYLLKHLLNRYREPILNEIKVRAKARIFQGAQAQP